MALDKAGLASAILNLVLIYHFTQDRIIINKTRKGLKPCII